LYDSSDEEYNIEEEESISILLACRAIKKPKIGGSIFDRQILWRERIEGHEKLMQSYFNVNLTYPESYFWWSFRMIIKLFTHIATEEMKFDRFFEQRRMPPENLGIAPITR
jgi:hypothetical protein